MFRNKLLTLAICFMVSDSISSRHREPDCAWGWDQASASKFGARAGGVVKTKGRGAAAGYANSRGAATKAYGKGGAMSQTGFARNEDSWARKKGWRKNGRKSTAFGSKWANRERTRGQTKAIGIGNGAVCSKNGVNGAASKARGDRYSAAGSKHQKQRDAWSSDFAFGKNGRGKSWGWKKANRQKKCALSQAYGQAKGRGGAASAANENGSKMYAKGTHGSRARGGHQIHDDSAGWAAGFRKNGRKSTAFKKSYGKKQRSRGFVDSSAFGNGFAAGGTDQDKGSFFKAKGCKGTASKFGFENNVDQHQQSAAFGKGFGCRTCKRGRRLGARWNPSCTIKKLKKQLCECRTNNKNRDKYIRKLQNEWNGLKKNLADCRKRNGALKKKIEWFKRENCALRKRLKTGRRCRKHFVGAPLNETDEDESGESSESY